MSEAPENVIPFASPKVATNASEQNAGATVTIPRARYERIEAELIDNVATFEKLREENADLRRALKAADDARDAADARLLTLAQSLADALAFQRRVEEACARNGNYRGGEA